MAVVINDFEVLSERQPEPRTGAPDTAGNPAPAEKIEPCALAAALLVLDKRALRTWSH